MANCGVSVNVNNLQGEIVSKVKLLVNFSGIIGTPAGLAGIQGALATSVQAIKVKVNALISATPFASDFVNLRDQIGEYAKLPDQFAAGAVSKLESILGDYAGIVDIDGFVNVDLANLAKTAFSGGITFDPCAIASAIPNIVKSADGSLITLPQFQPNLGNTDYGSTFKSFSTPSIYENDLLSGLSGNVNDISLLISDASGTINTVTSLTDINNIRDAFENNVSTSISALGQSLKKTKTGATILQSQEDFLLEEISFSKFLEEG